MADFYSIVAADFVLGLSRILVVAAAAMCYSVVVGSPFISGEIPQNLPEASPLDYCRHLLFPPNAFPGSHLVQVGIWGFEH